MHFRHRQTDKQTDRRTDWHHGISAMYYYVTSRAKNVRLSYKAKLSRDIVVGAELTAVTTAPDDGM